MSPPDEPVAAVLGRQRARSRVRVVTLTVGAAGLVGAGYIAAHLPAPPHPAGTGTTGNPSAGTGATTPAAPSYGDDGGAESGSGDGYGAAPAPAGTAPAGSHATSGGS